MNFAPIILFTYKRLDTLKKTIISLKKNKEAKKSELIIFSDGYKNEQDKKEILKVRKYIKKINGFKKIEIYLRKKNLGLANNIVRGLKQVFKKKKLAIILEDDLVVSPSFLNYMNYYLRIYRNNKNVASVHGYCYPLKSCGEDYFFLKGADCWGWATWKRAWLHYENNTTKLINKLSKQKLQKEFDYNYSFPYFQMLKHTKKTNNSWAIKWHASTFLKNMFTLYPTMSFVRNIGHDGVGTNCTKTNKFFISKLNKSKKFKKVKIQEDLLMKKKFENFFRTIYKKKTLFIRTIEKLKKIARYLK